MSAYRPKYKVKKRTVSNKRGSSEKLIHSQVCRYIRNQYADVIFRTDFAAGLWMSITQAKLNASLQSGNGFPDIFIYKKSREYNGLAIELKADGVSIYKKNRELVKNDHIIKQAKILQQLNNEGYLARFAVGYDEAVRLIDWYFERPITEPLF